MEEAQPTRQIKNLNASGSSMRLSSDLPFSSLMLNTYLKIIKRREEIF